MSAVFIRWPTSANVQKTHNTTVLSCCMWVFRQHNKIKLLCCGCTHNTTQTTVTQKCQHPENPQHNNLKLLCCDFHNTTVLSRQHNKMELLLWTYPQHNANYGDLEVPTSRKPTTQQLKTVVLWVFWTLALVGHRIFRQTRSWDEKGTSCKRLKTGCVKSYSMQCKQ